MKLSFLIFILIGFFEWNGWAQSSTPTPAQDVAHSPSSSPTSQESVLGSGLMSIPKPSDLLNGIIEDYNYIPQGKRDPFAPFEGGDPGADSNTLGPLFPLQKYDLDQLRLVGVIWEVKKPKALVLDPTGNSHVVGVNDRIGRNNGYVARIRQGEIVIVESYREKGKTNYQTQVLKLSN